MVALIIWLVPAPQAEVPVEAAAPAAAGGATAAAEQNPFAKVKAVVDQRCVMCHSATMQSKGIRLDSAGEIKRHAQALYQQAVVVKLMPLNNATNITQGERDLLKKWYEDGAKVE
jgi:uncharacterized membrane protein